MTTGGRPAQTPSGETTSVFSSASFAVGANRLIYSNVHPLIEGLRYFSYTTQRRTLPKQRVLDWLGHVFILVQLLSFAFEPSLFYPSDTHRAAAFRDAPVGLQILRVFKYTRSWIDPCLPAAVIGFALFLLFLAVLAFQILSTSLGHVANRLLTYALKLTAQFGTALVPFFVSAMLLWLQHPPPLSGGDITVMVLSAIGTLCALLAAVHYVLFSIDFRQTWGEFAESHPRIRLPRSIVVLTLVALDSGMGFGGRRVLPFGVKVMHSACVLVLMCLDFVTQVTFMSYFSKLFCEIRAGFVASAVGVSLIQLVATCVASSSSSLPSYLLIAAACACVPCAVVGMIIQRLRYRHIIKKGDLVYKTAHNTTNNSTESNNATASSAKDTQAKNFRFPFEVDLALRYLYNHSGANKLGVLTPDDLEKADCLLACGERQFPQSVIIALAKATYLAEIRLDIRQARRTIVAGMNMARSPDIKYQLYCLWESLLGRDSKEEDLAVDISMAKLHHMECKRAIEVFWGHVMRSRKGDDDLRPLMAALAKLDFHEQHAIKIFSKLLERNMRSVPVIRAYADFLLSVTDEREKAEELLTTANELEDQFAQNTAESSGLIPIKAKRIVLPPPIRFEEEDSEDVCDGDDDEDESEKVQPITAMTSPSPLLKPYNTPKLRAITRDRSDTTTSSSNEQVNSGTDRARILQYRTKISLSRSSAVKFLRAGVFVGWGLLFLISLAIGISVVVVSQSDKSKFYDYQHFTTLSTTLTDAMLVPHRIPSSVSPSQAESWIYGLEQGWVVVKTHSQYREFLDSPANITTTTSALRSSTVREALDMAVLYAKQIFLDLTTTTDSSNNDTATLSNSTAALVSFLDDNVLSVVMTPLLQTADSVHDNGQDSGQSMLISVWVISAFSLVVCVLSFWVLFVPNLLKLRAERTSAFHLFHDLPKSSCANEMQRTAADLLRMEQLSRNNHRVTASAHATDVTLLVTVVFSAAQVLLVAFIIATAIAQTFASLDNTNYINAIRLQSSYHQSLSQLQVLSQHNRSSVSMVEAVRGRFIASGSDLTDVVESLDSTHLNHILFTDPCPYLSPLSCSGLMQYNQLLIDKVANDHSSQQIQNMSINSAAWMADLRHAIIDAFKSHKEAVDSTVYCVIALSVVLLPLAYLLIRPLLRALECQTLRGLQLLLSLPISMLLSIDSIRHFLERGFSDYQASSRGIAAEHEQVTKAILEGNRDAVVITNDSCDVVFFNPAAERLTGYKASDVLGRSIDPIFDQDTSKSLRSAVKEFCRAPSSGGEKTRVISDKRFMFGSDQQQQSESPTSSSTGHDFFVVSKENVQIPILLSSIDVTSRTGKQFAFFIKDIHQIKETQEQYDFLLHSIFPDAIISSLRKNPGADVACQYDQVTVMFADIVDFTPKAAKLSPQSLLGMLNNLFSRWDLLCEEHGIEKIKTIGDCYMCAAGVPVPSDDHAVKMIKFCVAAIRELASFNDENPQWGNVQVRIGVHTGTVVAGVIGRCKFQYDLWGDTVNIASRLESTGIANTIQISKETRELVKEHFEFRSRGFVRLKGKGERECFIMTPFGVTPTYVPPLIPNTPPTPSSSSLAKVGMSGSKSAMEISPETPLIQSPSSVTSTLPTLSRTSTGVRPRTSSCPVSRTNSARQFPPTGMASAPKQHPLAIVKASSGGGGAGGGAGSNSPLIRKQSSHHYVEMAAAMAAATAAATSSSTVNITTHRPSPLNMQQSVVIPGVLPLQQSLESSTHRHRDVAAASTSSTTTTPATTTRRSRRLGSAETLAKLFSLK